MEYSQIIVEHLIWIASTSKGRSVSFKRYSDELKRNSVKVPFRMVLNLLFEVFLKEPNPACHGLVFWKVASFGKVRSVFFFFIFTVKECELRISYLGVTHPGS